MIKLGELNHQPDGAWSFEVIKIVSFITLAGIFMGFIGKSIDGFNFWLGLMIFIGLPTSLFVRAQSNAVSFTLTENRLEINWGIIMKKSKTIMLNAVQNIKIEKDILPSLCGVWILKIWTASPGQVNHQDDDESHTPDGYLIISKEDAKWLNDKMADLRL